MKQDPVLWCLMISPTKNSVMTFLDTLLSKLLSSNVKLLHIWSDGPASQFKNKFVAAALPWLAERRSVDFQWHYFATSHGKGCVDGIGGTVKHEVAEKVKQLRVTVKDASSFYQATQLINSATNFFFISIKDIEESYAAEHKSIFENAASIPRTSSMHRISMESRCMITAAHSLLPFSKPAKKADKRNGGRSGESCPKKVRVNKEPKKKM